MTRLIALLFALFFALPAYAAPAIDQKGADALRPRITDALNYIASSMQKSGIQMKRVGDVMVEPAGSYYAITAPNITLQMPDGITRTVGMVAINAIPTDDPDMYKVAVALPTPMMDTDASGNTVGALSIGQQMMNGLWSMPAGTFIEMNGSYKDIHLTNTARALDVTIPAMTLTSNLTKNGKFWQGPAEAVLTGVSHQEGGSLYRIGTLRIRADARELDFTAPARATPAANLSVAQSIFTNYLTRYANAVDSTVTADNISFQSKDRSGTMKTASFQSSMTNLRGAVSNAAWNLGLNDIASTDASVQRFTPSRIALKGAGDKLPVAELASMAQGASIAQILSKANSDITIENLVIDAPAYGVDAKGAFNANPSAPLGGTGNLQTSIRGLEELNTFLSSPAAPKVLGINTIPPQVIATLAIVQMVGKDGKDASGRATRNFDLKVAGDGKILVNGADMSALTQLSGAASTPGGAAAASAIGQFLSSRPGAK